MRVAVLGAAGAALVGATLVITPLDTPGAPVRAPAACGNGAGGSCERLAAVLAPQAGAQAAPAALAAPPAPAPLAVAPPPPNPAAASVIAPGLAPGPGAPSAAVPGLGVPGVPGTAAVPGVGLPGIPGIPGLPTDINGYDVPGLMNQAYALVNGVVGAEVAASTIGPITSGVLGAAGIVAGLGGTGINALITLAYLNRLNGGSTIASAPEASKLVSMLAPTVTAAVNSAQAQLPAATVQALTNNLRALPPPNFAALPSPAAVVEGLKSLPPPQLPPPPPPPPMVCGPWFGPFRPCI
jgi:hypothetical protein